MKNKALKKISAILAAGTLMVSMCSMTALAAGVAGDGVSSVTTVNVQKTVLTDGNTFAPNFTFTFEVTSGAAGKFGDDVVYAGVEGGLVATAGATFSPGEEASASYTATGSLTVNNVFTTPGVYHYVVKESNVNYEGIINDDSSYDVYLYVYNGEEGCYVGHVVSTKNGEKSDLAFSNDYGSKNDTTHDVTITKKVEGNQGDTNKSFEFKVSVKGADGEKYKVLWKETATSNAVERVLVSGADPVTFTMKDGGSIQIFGLSVSDKYTVDEEDYTAEGYQTTGEVKDGNVTADNTMVTITNTKNANTPTGIIASYAPYILMVVVAGAAVVLFLRRRNRAEF